MKIWDVSQECLKKLNLSIFHLGEAFNKEFKKKVSKDKYNNDLVYDSVYNFNKYRVFRFNEISLVDSKFDTLNKFYKDFKKLNDVKSQNENTKQKRINMLKNASLIYDDLVDMYEKECNEPFESKDMTGGKNTIIKI